MKELAPGIRVLPLRTPTLPPATHTNCYVAGNGRLTVFDPASPWEDEQARLWQMLSELARHGQRVERIVLTHHHGDHVAGALALQAQLAAIGFDVPIAAHAVTDAWLPDLAVQEHLDMAKPLVCDTVAFEMMHTPGHAPGHVVFRDVDSGMMVAGDMVAAVGTILIDPHDGHLGEYLASLQAMRATGPTVLLPAHGDPLEQPEMVLSFYVAHRHQRTEQIVESLRTGGRQTAGEVAAQVYAELPKSVLPIATRQVTSHLRWLLEHGLATVDGGYWSV